MQDRVFGLINRQKKCPSPTSENSSEAGHSFIFRIQRYNNFLEVQRISEIKTKKKSFFLSFQNRIAQKVNSLDIFVLEPHAKVQ